VTYVEIDAADGRFQVRVAAVCVRQGHVLLQRALEGDFCVLPGGRILPFEPTAEAMARTMRWEIGQQVTVGRLLWVMEYLTPMGGRPVHELGFYYAVDLPADSPFLDLGRDHTGVERGHVLLLRWHPIANLAGLALYPEFLTTSLERLPAGPQHIVQVDVDRRPVVDARASEDAP
jgi:ADP-ribose pyrophosphatase YjhB (NUDIX family)